MSGMVLISTMGLAQVPAGPPVWQMNLSTIIMRAFSLNLQLCSACDRAPQPACADLTSPSRPQRATTPGRRTRRARAAGGRSTSSATTLLLLLLLLLLPTPLLIFTCSWSNWKGTGSTPGWAKQSPMDCEERLSTQVQMTTAASPLTKVWVYRNSILALPWYTSVSCHICRRRRRRR